MTKLKLFIPILLLYSMTFISCKKDNPEIVINDNSIIPTSNFDHPKLYLECIEISTRITNKTWDHGQIDGDIASIIVKDEVIVDEQTHDGTL